MGQHRRPKRREESTTTDPRTKKRGSPRIGRLLIFFRNGHLLGLQAAVGPSGHHAHAGLLQLRGHLTAGQEHQGQR